MQHTHADFPGGCRKQVKGSLKFILGFPTINTCIGSAVVNLLLGRTASSWWPQTPAHALLQFVAAAVVNDFGLYVGELLNERGGCVCVLARVA